jgi:hypothetical protein
MRKLCLKTLCTVVVYYIRIYIIFYIILSCVIVNTTTVHKFRESLVDPTHCKNRRNPIRTPKFPYSGGPP